MLLTLLQSAVDPVQQAIGLGNNGPARRRREYFIVLPNDDKAETEALRQNVNKLILTLSI